jgi:hydroxymethylglutaryl-CoA lyase
MNALDLPESAKVVEMLPRDGFQNYGEFVPTEEKVEMIDALSTTGVEEIEFTSFTHPKAVPNLRDADEVATAIDRNDSICYRALVPNAVGMERAMEAGVDKVNALVTVSETYTRKNQNMTVEENVSEIEAIVELAEGTDVEVEAGMGTSFFCPYEGHIPQADTLAVVEAVLEAGVDEVTLATTMGMANPRQMSEMLGEVYERFPEIDLGIHLHDTNGMSLANTLVAMQYGVERFDASVCGLGGGVVLPEALRGVGNTPTEDLSNMLREMGVETNVDFHRLVEVAEDVTERLELDRNSHVLLGGTAENVIDTVQEEKQ